MQMSYSAGAAETGLPHLPSTVNAVQVREAWIDASRFHNLIFGSLRALDLQHCTLSGAQVTSPLDRRIESCALTQVAEG